MSKATNALPDVARYPDLERRMVVELAQAGCCDGRSSVISKFRRRVAERDKQRKK